MEVKGVKAKFSKLAIVMGVVLALMSSISVVGMACLFCDEPIEEQETIIVVEEEEPVVEPVVIPNTDAVKWLVIQSIDNEPMM